MSATMKINTLANAMNLAEEYGLPVFPVRIIPRSDGKSDKIPLTEHGFKDATTDAESITKWWTRTPDAAVGVPTGKNTKIFLVDIDPDGDAWYRENAARLECGRTHRTARGWHLVYSMPDDVDIVNSAGKVAKGVDVRGNGGFMIWWPATGGECVGGMEDIKPAPAWLLKAILESKANTATVTPLPSASGKVGAGQRNDFLSREAYRQKKLGATQEQIFDVLNALNDARCDPPINIDELIQIVRGKAAIAADPQTGESPSELWTRYGLDRPDSGAPYATASNVVRVLNGSPEFSTDVIWYDEFRERVLTTWRAAEGRSREWCDEDDACLLVHLQGSLSWHKLSSSAVHEGLRAFLQGRRRNPLLEYLHGLVWDGIERLPTFLADAYETPQDAYHEAVGRCWLISMIARAMRPGCQVDTIPVLEGAQGIKKSTSLEILGGEFYVSLPRGFGDVEFLQVMEGCWLGEIPDMASFRGRDLEHIKAFITIREDRYRRKYARAAITRPRQCVFAATDNTGDWNGDVTGARRFWPFVCKTVNVEYLKANRDQLFAEAVARFTRGEPWWDVPVGDQVEQADSRRFGDAWEQVIERYVNEVPNRERAETYWHKRPAPLTELSVNDILEHALDIPAGRWDRASQMRVSKSLQALGWRRMRRETAGVRRWAYVKDGTR